MTLFHRRSVGAACPGGGLFVAACLTAGLLGTLAGCQKRPVPQPQSQPAPLVEAPPPPEVEVVRPRRKTVRRSFKRPGFNVEPYQRTAVYAKISGYVRKWNVDIGAKVTKGQVLAELWVPEMEVDVLVKDAAAAQAEAEIGQAQAALLRAQAEQDRARSQLARMERIRRENGVVNDEQVDEARYGFEAAKAAVAKAQADVKVAQKRLEVARRGRDYADTMLRYAKVPAPFDGVVTRRYVNDDDFVQPPTGKKEAALFVVDQVDPVRVVVYVPEVEAVWVRPGAVATVYSDSLAGQELKGEVTRTAGALDPDNRTLRTEIELPNPGARLLSGTYAEVLIVVEHPKTWALPASAVVTDEKGESFCYQVQDNKLVRTAVRVGLRGGDLMEVVEKQGESASPGTDGQWANFNGEERVVKKDVAGLKDGQAVRVAPGSE